MDCNVGMSNLFCNLDVTMNIDPIAVPIPIPQDRVIPDWPQKKAQRVEETAKAIDKKVDRYKYDSEYQHHPQHRVDFIIA
mgnify:CR=1 FL=1